MASFAESNKFIAVYQGEGASLECVDATKQLLKDRLPSAQFLEKTDLSLIFRNHASHQTIVVLPGGNALFQAHSIPSYHLSTCRFHFNQFISLGGSVHATCASAILLSSELRIQYDDEKHCLLDNNRLLNTVAARAFAPMLYGKSRSRGEMYYTEVELAEHDSLPESLRGKTVRFTDADSPGWDLHGDASVLGWYSKTDKPKMSAILTKQIKEGTIWMQGPHLEFLLSDVPSYKGSETLTKEEQATRLELFNHSFRILGLTI